MELRDIKTFRKGMVAFAEKQRLMTKITRVANGEIDFYVMNGCWEGTIRADGTAFHMHGDFSISKSDFKQVISVTPDEYEQWYMRGEPGVTKLVQRPDKLPVVPEVLTGDPEGSSVHEIQILVTVQGQDPDPAALTEWVRGLSLAELDHHMNEGELIGRTKLVSSETLPHDQVGPRLKDLANDGAFFNLEDTDFDVDAKKNDASGRILNVQMAQGWSTESLEMQSRRFIEKMGLSDTYARFIEDQAREENDLASDMDDEPEF
jgi:hypothetical protein